MKCINCGAEFEAERCPECGLSRRYNKVLYRYEERQREKESGDYRPKHKKKKKKPVYKKWWVWALVAVLAIGVIGVLLGGNADEWSEEDFSFYDESGAEKVFLTVDKYYIPLSDTPDLKTYRSVRIGDKAVTAINKYSIPYDMAVLGESGSNDIPPKYTRDIDLEEEIAQAAAEQKTLVLALMFDDEFEAVDAQMVMSSMPNAPQDYKEGYYWMVSFHITDERIADIWFARHYLAAGQPASSQPDADAPEVEPSASSASVNEPTPEPAQEQPLQIEYSTIYKAYKENELRADNEYQYNRYIITAKVNGMETGGLLNLTGGATLTMEKKVDNTVVFFTAEFEKEQEDALSKISVGDEITFSGKCLSAGTWSECEIL